MDMSFSTENQTHGIMVAPTVGTSRCGEIFVTNNADKWIYVCSHCQKATNDIGVFICHIRFDHLDSLQDVEEVKEIIPMTSAVGNFLPMEDKQNAGKKLILDNGFSIYSGTFCSTVSKIVDISSLTDSNETENKMSNKNSILTSYLSQEMYEEIFTQQNDFQSIEESKEFLNETCEDNTNQAQQEIIAIDDDEDTNDSDIVSVYSTNKDKSDDSIQTNGSCKASGSVQKISCLEYSCDFCSKSFEIRRSLFMHMTKIHKTNPEKLYRCKLCPKFFRSIPSFNNHLKTHDDKYQMECPICKVMYKANYFTTHVLTHESNTCFPCQVCGKMHTSQEERMEHWKTHAEELPIHCHICYRRFRKPQYLKVHLKSHLQYQCQFCPNQYNAVEAQKPPFVCSTCENTPDIKQRVEHQRLLANNPHVFDSDEDPTLE